MVAGFFRLVHRLFLLLVTQTNKCLHTCHCVEHLYLVSSLSSCIVLTCKSCLLSWYVMLPVCYIAIINVSYSPYFLLSFQILKAKLSLPPYLTNEARGLIKKVSLIDISRLDITYTLLSNCPVPVQNEVKHVHYVHCLVNFEIVSWIVYMHEHIQINRVLNAQLNARHLIIRLLISLVCSNSIVERVSKLC